LFGRSCSLIGTVHVPPLPGSAQFSGSMEAVLASALGDALTYKEEGMDALILENMHDVPYRNGYVDPETTAAMAVVAHAIKYETMLPTGVQLLAAANLESLGVALASGLDFIRVEGFVFAHIGDEGVHESCAAELIRRRSYLKADHVKIFADVKKKHSAHAITSDVSLAETALAAQFFCADGVIISGSLTGRPPELQQVQGACEAVSIPLIVGSGVDPKNLPQFAKFCSAVIVGSFAKVDGYWANPVVADRVAQLVHAYPAS
jgi:uncharacterized protein